MGREGADVWTSGSLYLAVVQAIQIFSSETWVVNPHIGKNTGSFHHWVIRRITGKRHCQQAGGRWQYPTIAEAMREAKLEELERYIYIRQNTFIHYITTRLILDLCLEVESWKGVRVVWACRRPLRRRRQRRRKGRATPRRETKWKG